MLGHTVCMTVSALRTVVLSPAAPFTVSPGYRWNWVAEPEDDLDYYADASLLLSDVSDTIVGISASAAPSGSGELQISNVGLAGAVISLWLTGGIPGRFYNVRLLCRTANQRNFSVLIGLQIDTALAQNPLTTPQSSGFGTQAIWPIGGPGIYGVSIYGGSVYA